MGTVRAIGVTSEVWHVATMPVVILPIDTLRMMDNSNEESQGGTIILTIMALTVVNRLVCTEIDVTSTLHYAVNRRVD